VKEQEAIAARCEMDVVIADAAGLRQTRTILVTVDMVKLMKPGAVIVDLAAEQAAIAN